MKRSRTPARNEFPQPSRAPLPASLEPIPVLRPRLPSAERLLPYLRRIDSTRLYSNYGPLVLELERRIAQQMSLRAGSVVTASSGTAALIGAILGVAGRPSGERRYALLPAYTFVGTALAVEQCGYAPYLADIDPATWMLDPAALAAHPDRDVIGLVVPVAPFGRPVSVQGWSQFREQTGIPVVIDGAASFEGVSEMPERFLGEIPVTLSFHATKSFATGEGGGIITTDKRLAERIAQTLNFGFYDTRDCRLASTNGKLSEYHAAVGLAELDEWVGKQAALRAVADGYRRHLGAVGLADRFFGTPDIAGCYALFRCTNRAEAARVRLSLQRHRVDFRLWYGEGIHCQSYFAGIKRRSLDITDAIAPCILGLPVAPDLSDTAIGRVVGALTAAL